MELEHLSTKNYSVHYYASHPSLCNDDSLAVSFHRTLKEAEKAFENIVTFESKDVQWVILYGPSVWKERENPAYVPTVEWNGWD